MSAVTKKIKNKDKKKITEIISSLETPKARKRAFVSLIGINAFVKFLEENKLDDYVSHGLSGNNLFLNNFDLADICVNNVKIDVRAIIGDEYPQMWIPRDHEAYGFAADIYVGIKINNKLNQSEIVGFIRNKDIVKSIGNSKYVIVDSSQLKHISELESALNSTEPRPHSFLSSDHEISKNLFLSYFDSEISESDKKFLLSHIAKCDECRREFLSVYSIEKAFSLIQDNDVLKGEMLVKQDSENLDSEIQNQLENTLINVTAVTQKISLLDKLKGLFKKKEEIILDEDNDPEKSDLQQQDWETAESFDEESNDSEQEYSENVVEENELSEIQENIIQNSEQYEEIIDHSEEQTQHLDKEHQEKDYTLEIFTDESELREQEAEIPVEPGTIESEMVDDYEDPIIDLDSSEDTENKTLFNKLKSVFEKDEYVGLEPENELSSDVEQSYIDIDYDNNEKASVEDKYEEDLSWLDDISENAHENLNENSDIELEQPNNLLESLVDEENKVIIEEDIVTELIEDNIVIPDVQDENLELVEKSDPIDHIEDVDVNESFNSENIIKENQQSYLETQQEFLDNDRVELFKEISVNTEETENSQVILNYENDSLNDIYTDSENDYEQELDFNKGDNKHNLLKAALVLSLVGTLGWAGFMYFGKSNPGKNPNNAYMAQQLKVNEVNTPEQLPANDDIGKNSNEKVQTTNSKDTAVQESKVIKKDNEPKQIKPRNINDVLATAFIQDGNAIKISNISWEISATLSRDPVFKNYLMVTGQALKMALSRDLLMATDRVLNNQIKIQVKLDLKGNISQSNIKYSSGSKQVDEIVLQTLKDTFNYTKLPQIETDKEYIKLNVIVSL